VKARIDLGCVKTSAREDRAELFSQLSPPGSLRRRLRFSNRRSRDVLSIVNFNFGVSTQPRATSDIPSPYIFTGFNVFQSAKESNNAIDATKGPNTCTCLSGTKFVRCKSTARSDLSCLPMLHLNSGAKRRRSPASTSSYGLFRPQINVTVD
jgi:hypothetical protein